MYKGLCRCDRINDIWLILDQAIRQSKDERQFVSYHANVGTSVETITANQS